MTINLLTFFLDEQLYGVAIEHVKQVLRAAWVTKLRECKPFLKGVVDIHGELIPVIDLRYLMGAHSQEIKPSDRFLMVDNQNASAAIVVDRIGEIRSVAEHDVITDPLQFTNSAAINHEAEAPLAYSGLLNNDEKITILLDLVGLLKADLLPDRQTMCVDAEEGGAA